MENVVDYDPALETLEIDVPPSVEFRYVKETPTASLFATMVLDTREHVAHIATLSIPSKVRGDGAALLRDMVEFFKTWKLKAITVTMQQSGAMVRAFTENGFKYFGPNNIWRLDL